MYFELLTNFGIFGTVLFMLYALTKVSSVFKACIQSKARSELALTLSICVAVAIHGIADITMFWPQTGFIIAFVLVNPNIYRCDKQNEAGCEA